MRSFQVISGENINAQQFINLRADAAGAANLLVHQQLGFFTLSTNPGNGKTLTLTINGSALTFTFVLSIGSSAGNVLIGASAAATCANLLALINQPQTTTATGVALSSANQTLLSYLSYALSGTTLTISSNNTSLYAPLISFSAATNATSDTWTSQTMQLYVEPGVFYIAGTRVVFAGGSTPTVTAPSTNPRIDVLSINSSGTLSWTTGAENASPTAPAYPNPASNLVLCELYNVVGETQLLDNANQSGSQGYVYNDVRQFQQPSMNWGAFSTDLIPDADGTRNLGSPGTEWNNGYFKNGVFVNGTALAGKYGGTGTDGALSVSSGTTNIDCANAAIVVKNYTSISITGTGAVKFINPHANGTLIILKSQSSVTLTSSAAPMIDASGMGAAGGTAGATGNASGGNGNPGNPFYLFVTNGGQGGQNTPAGGSGATTPTAIAPASPFSTQALSLLKYGIQFWVGGGGGGGGSGNASNNATQGAGGNGGGGLIIECGGALNFTTASGISVAGKNGGNPTNTTFGGAGGGGAGGFCLLTYASLTAASGTITVSGGTGGTNGTNSNAAGGGGGGNAYNAGSNGSAGTGTNTGTGATGFSLIAKNTEWS